MKLRRDNAVHNAIVLSTLQRDWSSGQSVLAELNKLHGRDEQIFTGIQTRCLSTRWLPPQSPYRPVGWQQRALGHACCANAMRGGEIEFVDSFRVQVLGVTPEPRRRPVLRRRR
jgi:hypothetical protein